MGGEGAGRLLAEMAEQPAVVERLLRSAAPVQAVAAALQAAQPAAFVLVARGSSDHAAVYGRYLLEIGARRLASLAAPSTVTLYGSGPDLSRTAVIAVSQSGRGEDVVAFLRGARQQGALTVALVNDPGSPLAQAAAHVLELHAGEEVSVPATKTVLAEMTLLAMLAGALAGQPAGDPSALPAAVAGALALRAEAGALAGRLVRARSASVVGRGFAYPAALETGLKLKEMAELHAEPFSAADFFHGPVTLVDAEHPVVVLDAGGRSSGPALAAAAEIRRRGGEALLVRAGPLAACPEDLPRLELRADLPEAYAPIPAVVLGQLLALELALARGLDPSSPRGLQKVTSTC